jgi:putative membrane protein
MNQEASKETAGDIATRLAHERTDAAMTRTRMAAERTLMAWIRTSLSMISFGFTILKFFEFLQQSQGPLGKFHGVRAQRLGLVLISLGTLILIPAIFQSHSLMKKMSILDGRSSWSLSLVVAILVGGFGLFAFAESVFRWFF